MNRELLVQYGTILKNHFKSVKLVQYFLAVAKDDDEIKKMIKYLNNNHNATSTDLDEFIIRIRQTTDSAYVTRG